jgi:hypothetical protein
VVSTQGEHPMNASQTVTYQVTANGEIVAEFPNGYLADQFARKFFTTRAARGKVVSIRRSDGKVPYTSAPDFS